MPQIPIVVAGINSTRQLPAAALPVAASALVEIQPATGTPPRQKIAVSDLFAGGATGNLVVGGYVNSSIAVGLAAVGTSQANGLALTHQVNIVATAASAAVGVILPLASAVGIGGWVDVYNDGPSNSFHVYGSAAGTDTIDAAAAGTGVVLTNAFWSRYYVTAAGLYVSYRSAIVRSA